MKRNRSIKWIAALSALLLLTSCAAAPDVHRTPEASGAAVQAGDTLTVTDDLGRSVEVPRKPDRVAALIGSFADIWVLSGGGDSLIAAADDTWTSFDLALDEAVVNLGRTKEISLEALLAAQPELVLASCNTQADVDLLPTLEALDIPVLCFQVDRFDEYLHMLRICTEITGSSDNYTTYGTQVQTQVEAAAARQDGSRPSVLYIRATASSCKAKGSEGSVLGEMLAELGCRNIADSEGALLEQLSLEAILAADPDDIFIVYQGADPTDAQALLEQTLLSNPAWTALRAVEEGRCFVMDPHLYNLKPNAQWGTAYEQLARLLYGA